MLARRSVVFSLLLTGCLAREVRPSPTCTDTVDVLHHDVELAVQLAPARLSGRGALKLRTRHATRVAGLSAHALEFTRITLGSTPLLFSSSADVVCVELPNEVPANTELSLGLEWSAGTTGEVPKFSNAEVWAGYRTAAWMPTVEDPAQRATLSLRVHTSADLLVSASGDRGPETRDGDEVVHHFTLATPVPPFMLGFTAGHFAQATLQVGATTLRALGPPGSDLDGALARTVPMLKFLEEKSGAPLPAREYTQVFVEGDAAQEAAGLVFLSASSLADVVKEPTDDWLFLHELAHQWFGVRVPCADFAHFWLNEGFATFLTGAWKQFRWGDAAWSTEVGRWRARSDKAHAEGRDAPIALEVAPAESALQARAITYSRGALVLQRLRSELGESVFWAGIARYVSTPHPGGARTDDLRVALEGASGRDLKPFFAQWVTRAAPELSALK